jgi:ABC-type multidrug transport system ATPase subunit
VTRAEIVRVDGVTKDVRPGFGLRTKRVLHDVSFCVREGEIFGFVGPNGAGKTTLLKILMGLSRATSGSARVLGHDVSETAFRRHVGFLPENPVLLRLSHRPRDARLLREAVRPLARAAPRAHRRAAGQVGLDARRRHARSAPTARACSSGSGSRRRSCTTPTSCSSTSR